MLRLAMRFRVRSAAMLVVSLLTLGLMATSALAQVTGEPVPDCPVGSCAGQGQSVPGGDVGGGSQDDDDDSIDVPDGAGGGGTAPGPAGAPGTGSRDGADGADQFGGSPRDQGQPGRPGSGQPGRSGNPSPTPSVRTPTAAGGRTIPSYAPPRPGSTSTNQLSAQASQVSGQPLLPFDVIPSPFPTLEPSPEPSPSPSPTDLVAAIDEFDTDTAADEGTSLVPLLVVLAGAAMLFFYFRMRKRSMRSNRISPGRFR